MRKQERRAWMCLLLALVLFTGVGIFSYRFVHDGGKWASFYGNFQVYTDGMINRGTITDRYGTVLMECTPDGIIYNDDNTIRESTIHAVGDPEGNIPGGAINVFKEKLIGYDILNGTYDTTNEGKKIALTIDADANAAAYYALGGYTGTVGVFNWKTGEILCMVSTPSFDPAYGIPENPTESIFYNNFFDGLVTPGSTFKLVTSAAVIEKMDNRHKFKFECDGVNSYSDADDFTCVYNHGEVDFKGALAGSCNGAFGKLTRKLGAKTMEEYTKKVGLMDPVVVNGIETAAGVFRFPSDDDVNLSWAGIGQGDDLVNPCALMVYMGAIANGGEAVQPSIFKSATFIKELTGGKSLGHYIEKDTAIELKAMMKNNVQSEYGESNYADLDIYAKTGSAQHDDRRADAWFAGFIDNPDAPYAFVVWVEGGESGSGVAGPIARDVLYQLIDDKG